MLPMRQFKVKCPIFGLSCKEADAHSLPCIADIISFALACKWVRAEPGMPKQDCYLGMTGSEAGLQGGHASVFR